MLDTQVRRHRFGTGPNSASTTGCRGSSRSPSPTPSSREHLVRVQPFPVVRRPAGPRGVRNAATSTSPGRSRSSWRRTPTPAASRNRAAVVHVICAAPQFTDKGKVALVVPAAVEDRALAALDKATKALRQEAEQRRKDASKADGCSGPGGGRTQAATEPVDPEGGRLRGDAGSQGAAGHVVAARTLYYKVRPLVQAVHRRGVGVTRTSRRTLLPEYEREYGPLEGCTTRRAANCTIPTTSVVIRLGTREVDEYELPPWQFDKILYIEKMGLKTQLAPYQLGSATTWPSSTERVRA